MKCFHLGDLHFGKTLHDIDLSEQDQPYWTERFLEIVAREKPDAVLLCGDIYDRRAPRETAMKPYERLLVGLAESGTETFVIPGNHDSADRLGHVRQLLTANRIYIAGPLNREHGPVLDHYTRQYRGVTCTFWLMPYMYPVQAAELLGRDDLTTYDAAVRALLEVQPLDDSHCNILLAHQNVLANGVKPEHSESETIIGGLGEIDFTAFDRFDYVALGHIHNAQKVGRETVRYAGCPMYYDFSEVGRSKELTAVEIGGKDTIEVKKIPVPLLHELRQFTGTLTELELLGRNLQDREKYYVQAVLTGKETAVHTADRLKAAFGQCLINIKTELTREITAANFSGAAQSAALPIDRQFARFFADQNDGRQLEESQERLLEQILNLQNEADSWVTDWSKVPDTDSEALLTLLRREIGEVEA